MIVARMDGGLGNQMFQYALASILAQKNNATVRLDMNFFDQTEKRLGHTPRNFELTIFNNFYTPAATTDILFFKQLSVFSKVKRDLGFNYPKMYQESSFSYDEKVMTTRTPVYLSGFFQSYKYFIGYENLIRKLFAFPVETLDEVNKKVIANIKSTNAIAIHIRRGDYVTDATTKQYHGNCSVDYYFKAISLLAERNKDFTLFFFSDDNNWVKEQFENLPYSKQFINHNNGGNSWKDMFLMSSCNHNIIANSSFSWWAAWLNANPEKRVIAPKKWFEKSEEQMNTKDLIPPEWMRL
ncbi:alpha-1,2-fucosyltransferase [Flavobacterium yafengii]|uniref:alpha-1,2-fucosyltransferase n=1 Tax=Flavobacterium yafengii TaxID=3041253 RepID=UPI0024A8CDD8|nr:alpha-1,2-fucosyltransferase [Flavobacterium yafengii]MDI6046611.1 alpha-1,2-fucosyltransferase [Flavobacterium yafengii]